MLQAWLESILIAHKRAGTVTVSAGGASVTIDVVNGDLVTFRGETKRRWLT